MIACPICATECAAKREPYWICPNCACWFQSPAPSKVYWHPDDPKVMSGPDRAVNRDLARWLFEHVMQGKPGRTLDIGSGWPFLAHCLREFGCDAFAIDGEVTPSPDLSVQAIREDFELWLPKSDGPRFALITMIHNFEHCYAPLAALRKLRNLIADDGRVFLRLPDHNVPGFERDLTEHHYAIHPFFHCLDSILEALRVTQTFLVAETSVMNGVGQRDIVLRPIT